MITHPATIGPSDAERLSPHMRAMLADYGCRPHPFQPDEFQLLLENGLFQEVGNRVELRDDEIVVTATGERFRFTCDQTYQMADLHLFEEIRWELLEGEVIEVPGQKNIHAAGITKTFRAVDAVFLAASGYWVRIQMTLDLRPYSSPDPDIAVILGDANKPTLLNPTSALLVVEVSNSSLRLDRKFKGPIYAAAGILDYWIVNLVDRQLEIYRDSQDDPTTSTGKSYASRTILGPADFATPLATPQARIAVADLLP